MQNFFMILQQFVGFSMVMFLDIGSVLGAQSTLFYQLSLYTNDII